MKRNLSQDEFDEALSAFRASVRTWSEKELQPGFPFRQRLQKFGSCFASVCLLASLCFPMARYREAALEPAADSLVLERIDAEISRGVPRSMEPLLDLVSWEQGSR